MIFSMYWIMVVSLDQCFCECVISHSGGNSNRRWHRAVFPGRSPGQAGSHQPVIHKTQLWSAACHVHDQPPPSLHPAGPWSNCYLGRFWCLSDPSLGSIPGGISSISTVATTFSKILSSHNQSLWWHTCSLLWSPFSGQSSSDAAMCMPSVSFELNMPSELHQHGSVTGQDNPPTATIAICADTTPPPSSNTTAPSDPKHHPAELIFLASWLVAQRSHHSLLLFCFLSSLPSKLVWSIE